MSTRKIGYDQNNLAIAYSNRIRGERAENIEKAISYYQQALEVLTRQAYPELWALTQNNLATAYWNRILGERPKTLSRPFSTTSRRWKCIPVKPTRKIGP